MALCYLKNQCRIASSPFISAAVIELFVEFVSYQKNQRNQNKKDSKDDYSHFVAVQLSQITYGNKQ